MASEGAKTMEFRVGMTGKASYARAAEGDKPVFDFETAQQRRRKNG